MDGSETGDGGMHDPDDFDRGNGDPEIGKELTMFFLDLLSNGKDLRDYYDRGKRDDFITGRGLSTRASTLVREGSLSEIEEHILAVRGSYAKPLVIVWPAM